MKTVLILACFVCLATADISDFLYQQFTRYLEPEARECKQELKLPEESMEKFLTERHHTEVDTMGCMAACAFKKKNIIENGKFELAGVRNWIRAVAGVLAEVLEPLDKLAVECVGKTKDITKECEAAVIFSNCASDGLQKLLS